MTDLNELRCNNLRSCRKVLSEEGRAVVTTCSHIFCVDCAELLFGASKTCPACESSLTEPDDVVICSLNPSNDYRTSVLSGLAPSIIMEIATRALSFWQYQTTQEGAYQALLLQKTQDRSVTLERSLQMATSEAQMLKAKIHSLEKEVETEKHKSRNLAEAARVKEREYGKLKNQFDKMKRKSLLLPTSDGNALGGLTTPAETPSVGRGVGLGSMMDDLARAPLKQPTINRPWPSASPTLNSRTSTGSTLHPHSSNLNVHHNATPSNRPFHPSHMHAARHDEGGFGGGGGGGGVGGASGVGRMSSVGLGQEWTTGKPNVKGGHRRFGGM